MSTTIDQRVVEMQFDNRRFEQNVKTSMSTIDKLKQSLNLTGAAKGLEEIDSVSRKINFSAMGNAVETVQAKFSALQIMGITALTNITNSAVNAGKRISSALTIDPIKTGFSEYETQINAVQTILANTESKGTTLQDVNSALDTLNTYADKTIYNFTEMTKNIGTFTAAGVDLDTSVKSIQGIANLAAVSGSTSQQASTAMYQLSQALAAGKVSLMDWNSVVNAGMGGQVFQDALKRTAKAMGTDVDAIIKKYGSFRESLTQGEWLTTDVLTKTLEQFTMAAEEGSEAWETYKKSLMSDGYTEKQAEEILKMANTATDAATKVKTVTQLWDTLKESAQSGWTQTWEIIMGDFGESKKFLTKVSDTIGGMIGSSAEARNSLLEGGLSTGWKQLLGAGIADEAGYTDTLKTVAKEHGVSIDDMIKKEKELDNSLSDGEAFQNALKKGLADGTLNSDMLSESVDKMATKMSKMSAKEREAAGYTVEHVEQIKKLNEGLKNGTISMDEFTKKIIRPSGRENIIESLWNAFEGLMSVIKPIKEAFREVFPPMTSEQLYQMTVNLKEFTSRLKLSDENAEKLKTAFKGLFSVIDIGVTFIKDLLGGAVKLIKNFTGLGGCILDNASSLGEWLINLHDSVTASDAFGKTIDKIVNFLSKGITAIKNFGKTIADNFKMPDFSGFLSIMKGVWSVIKMLGSTAAKLLAPLGRAINEIFEGANLFDVLESGLLAGSFVGITKLSGGFEEIWDKVKGVTDLFDGEEGFFTKLKNNVFDLFNGLQDCFKSWQQNVNATILMKIAGAIAILTAALFVLSRIDKQALDQSLGAVTLMFVELISAFGVFNKFDTGGIFGAAKPIGLMIAISASMLILAAALKSLSTLNWDQLSTGILGIGGLMLEVWTFMVLIDSLDFKPSTGVALILLGAALKVFASAVEDFTEIEGNGIGRSLKTIGALLFEIWAFAALMDNVKINASTGVALILLGAALKVFASAVEDFGKMSPDELGKGLLAMAGALVEVAIAMDLLPTNIVGKGVGLIAVGAALHILASALDSFQMMSWEEIGRGLVAMGGALSVLGLGLILMTGTLAGSASLIVATIALAGLVPVLKTLGGMTWTEIGKGLITIAGAIAIIGAAGYILMPIIPFIMELATAIAMIGLSVVAVGAGLTLIGVGMTAIGAGITSLGVSLAAAASSIVAGLTVIILGLIDLVPSIISRLAEWIVVLCNVIKESIPTIVDTLLAFVAEILTSLAKYTPQIADAIFTFVIGLLDVFAERLPELIKVAVKFIGQFFQGVVDALGGLDTTNLIKGIAGVGLLSGLMLLLSAVAGLIPGAMIGVLGMGIVIAELAAVLAIVGGLAQIPGLSWLISEGGNFLQTIGTAIGQFIGGIAGGIAQGITSSLPQMGTDLANFMTNVQPFIDGAKTIDSSVLDGVKTLVGVVMGLTAADVLEGLTSWITGGSSLAKFGEEIAAFGPHIKTYADSVAGIDAAAISASANAAKALSDMAICIFKGDILSWFTGDNSISNFASELETLGTGLSAYATAVAGIDTAAIIASSGAAKALAEMTSYIPNEGGVIAWFTGENSIAKFALELESLGTGLSAYATAVAGINPETIIASAGAAKALADMTSYIPNEGGVVAWFTGENSISKFSTDLETLGKGLSAYSAAVAGLDPASALISVAVAKAIADMTSYIPNEGGIVTWFTGDNSIANFADQLPKLGTGLKDFSTEVEGIKAENVIAAAYAAKALAQMANTIPNEGGIKAWFTGDNSVSKFADQLPALGDGLSGFSESVAGIIPENITAAASAAKTLAQMADTTPKNTGKIVDFGTNLATFGTKLKSYFDNTSNITQDAISLSTYALNSIKKSTSGFDSATINTAASAIKTMVDAIKKMAKVKASDVNGFNDALKKIGVSNVKTITTTFEDASPKLLKAGKELIGEFVKGVDQKKSDVKKAGQKALEQFADGIESKEKYAKTQCTDVVDACVKAISNRVDRFKSAGKSMVEGFAYGISANTYLATAKARAMANAAEKAAKEELDINSPSKVFRSIGYSVPEGFAMGIDKMRSMVTDSSAGMAESAINNVKTSISRMADIINSDIDSQPTIRPVVDLSSVKAGADSINGMFSDGITIDTSHVNRISTLMNQRNQNGANDDIVSAINKLRKDLGNVGNTSYNLNGLTYNEGSDVAEAFKTIIRAATVERRV